MRAVIQRINGAEITINGGETRKVGEGLVVFICAMEGDTDAQIFSCRRCAACAYLRTKTTR